MNESDLLRKKTGMNIAKAWMLMMSGVVAFIVCVIIIGFINGFKKSGMKEDEKLFFCALLGVLLLCCLWGFFINKKELPFFSKQPLKITSLCLIVMLACFYISPVLYDFFPYESKSTSKDDEMLPFLEILLSLALTILQIGCIGHGLLKNYQFGQVLFTVVAMSIIFVIPQAVIGMAMQTLIMFYVYYRTASFQLPLLMTVIFSISEWILKSILKFNISNNNYIRTQLVPNTTLYYIGMSIAVGIIAGGLLYIKNHTNTIAWQRPDEDESMAFL